MATPENELDKRRFEEMKEAEEQRGRDPEEAKEIVAKEVKELRRREGRSKDDRS